MSVLRLYNTVSRKKEDFQPINTDDVRLYACGPTVYNYAHIGNARMAVVFDLLVRVLKHIYPKVTYVSNITDVDDKIINAAKETGVPIKEITEKYTRIYNEDMEALGVRTPDIQPKATEHIEDMIALTKALIERGHAYEAEGHVLFDVPSFPAYGKLSGRNRDEQIAGARVEVASYKKDPADFVLWKPSGDDEPGWDSPWGWGRPGWHLECSAMAEKHLGLPFDIHGGGADLKFPHHENEIAQSCCAHGTTDDITSFAKYWVHNGFVTVKGEKMAKSVGNITLVHDLLSSPHFGKYQAGEILRMALLSAHYRQPLDWSENKILQNKNVLDRFYRRLDEMQDMSAEDTVVPEGVMAALCDDLNTPQAMAEISGLLKQDNSPLLKGQLEKAGSLMGLLKKDPSIWLGYKMDKDSYRTLPGEELKIRALIDEREEAKKKKNYTRADEIRATLDEMGVIIEDTPSGPRQVRS